MSIGLMLLAAYLLFYAWFIYAWWAMERGRGTPWQPTRGQFIAGAVADFFDTLGIGSFAPTTAIYKFFGMVRDELIPGTLNVGYAVPTILQVLFFITVVDVELPTLLGMIAASVAGAWLGAGVVSRLPRRAIQRGMGVALLLAASLFTASNLGLTPAGGEALGLHGAALAFAVAASFVLGALMMLGIGFYAPCLIMVSLLGMNPIAAFPIMMGACSMLQPTGGLGFIRSARYDLRAAMGLTLGGIPGVLVAALIVKSMPMFWLRWLVVGVVSYAAITMLHSARNSSQSPEEAR